VIVDEEVSATKPQSAGSSTGAIPKSISFDKTAERGDKVEKLFSCLLYNWMWVFYKLSLIIPYILPPVKLGV